jgi:adenylyl cyclase-associated protein
VTSRLEDISSSQQSSPALKSPTSNSHDGLAGHVSAPTAGAAAAAVSGSAGGSEKSPAVKAYEDEVVNGALASLIAKSKDIGGIVEQHVSLLPMRELHFLALDTRFSNLESIDF